MRRSGRLKQRLVIIVGVVATALLILSAVALAGRSAGSTSTPPVAVDATTFGTFLGACNSTADCAEGLSCQSYKQNGLRCTHTCESDNDCAAPSKGCSKLHRCSMPTATAGHPRR